MQQSVEFQWINPKGLPFHIANYKSLCDYPVEHMVTNILYYKQQNFAEYMYFQKGGGSTSDFDLF